MSIALASDLPLLVHARTIRRLSPDVVDELYKQTPIGRVVQAFIAAKRYEEKAASTLVSYTEPLAWLALDHADLDLPDFEGPPGTRLLEDFRTRRWIDAAGSTRRHRHTVLALFFKWCVKTGRMQSNPMEALLPPKGRRSAAREPLTRDRVKLLLDQPPDNPHRLRDECALGLFALMGLRKNEVRLLQLRDIDLAYNVIRIRHPKGGGDPQVLDIGFRDLLDGLNEYVNWEGRDLDEYLLYPPTVGPHRPMHPSAVHRWFKRCLYNAGLPETIRLHELRHTAGDAMWRGTGDIVLAQKLLRHESPATTQVYLHPTGEDLRVGMRRLQEIWDAEDAN